MQEALQQFVEAFASYRMTHTLGEEETELLQTACTALKDVLCPFLAECLSRIFPASGQLLDISKITAALSQPQTSEEQQSGEADDVLRSPA